MVFLFSGCAILGSGEATEPAEPEASEAEALPPEKKPEDMEKEELLAAYVSLEETLGAKLAIIEDWRLLVETEYPATTLLLGQSYLELERTNEANHELVTSLTNVTGKHEILLVNQKLLEDEARLLRSKVSALEKELQEFHESAAVPAAADPPPDVITATTLPVFRGEIRKLASTKQQNWFQMEVLTAAISSRKQEKVEVNINSTHKVNVRFVCVDSSGIYLYPSNPQDHKNWNKETKKFGFPGTVRGSVLLLAVANKSEVFMGSVPGSMDAPHPTPEEILQVLKDGEFAVAIADSIILP